uniref:Putative tnf receptor-associated factor 6-a n=1 Tax=Ixodes ricinus TaxID=34613 RepID=V5HYJ4_IXORI
MPRKVQYRDFPGGPIEIEFSDELPHWNLCGVCGMLSAFMCRDELGHVFCKVCIDAHRQNKRIFCKHEIRFVELADLSAAVEIIQLTHDLTVFCPYKKLGCTEYRPLRFMKKHLVKCPLTTVMRCKACDAMLPIKDHLDHEALCPEAHVLCSICSQRMPRRKYKDHQNQCQRRPEPSHREENCRANQSGRAIEDNTAAAQQKFMQEARENILSLQEKIAEMEQRKREDDQSRLNMKDHIAEQEKLLQDVLEENLRLQEKGTGFEDPVYNANSYHLKIQDHINIWSKRLQDMANEVAKRSREPDIQTMGHDLSNRIKTCFNYVTKSVRGLPEEGFR